MPNAVIVDAVRTPIGRAAKGSLKDVRADDLAAVPLAALVERNPEVDFARTDDIVMGCGFPLGEQGYNLGRNAQLLAGIDHHVPAVTVSRFCSSSLQALRMAFHAIEAGEGDQYVAAGVEAVSRFPAQPPYDPHPQLDGSDGAPYNVYIPMGLTAENVAKRCSVSREAQDAWAASSQQRAVAAQESGQFDREIVPVTLADGMQVTKDDGPRPGTTVEVLAELKPAFDPENGTVTAGNACPLNDGAAAVLVMSAERAAQLGGAVGRHHQQRGGAVVERACVAGGHRAALGVERGLELGEHLRGRAGPRPRVLGHLRPVGERHRHDLGVELAGLLGGDRALL